MSATVLIQLLVMSTEELLGSFGFRYVTCRHRVSAVAATRRYTWRHHDKTGHRIATAVLVCSYSQPPTESILASVSCISYVTARCKQATVPTPFYPSASLFMSPLYRQSAVCQFARRVIVLSVSLNSWYSYPAALLISDHFTRLFTGNTILSLFDSKPHYLPHYHVNKVYSFDNSLVNNQSYTVFFKLP